MNKKPGLYITSDFHFGHWKEETQKGIITFERYEFETINQHDTYLINIITDWSEKWAPGSEFWFLGDFGSTDYLWVIDLLTSKNIKCNMIMGNHDKLEYKEKFELYFDNVYQYPQFQSNKLVFSHEPVAVYNDMVNVHGHLHGAKLKDDNHINASIAVANYVPVTNKHIANAFGKLPKYTRRFLYEPFAEDYQFTQPKEDVIMDKNGNIDLSASRVLMKLNKNNPHEYKGGLDA